VAGPLPGQPQSHTVQVPQDAQLAKVRIVAWVQDAGGKVLNAVTASCTSSK
jgi:hypothetical protein